VEPLAQLRIAKLSWGEKVTCKVIVVEKAGEHFPFVFAPHQILRRSMSTLILTYCRDFADYVRFAGAIGRHFLMRGIPSIVVDSDPRVRELRGVPIERRRYYARGPHPPRSGDIALQKSSFSALSSDEPAKEYSDKQHHADKSAIDDKGPGGEIFQNP
jgi:hypothetical protein